MIQFQNVTKIYPPDTAAVQEVSFEVQPGEFVSVVGKSGAGKTTLLKLVVGLEKPTYGEVFFEKQSVGSLEADDLQKVRRRVGSVYQDYRLLTLKTAFENVAYVMEAEGKNSQDIDVQVNKVLEAVGLADKANHFPKELSGGEQQRLAIARALVNEPDVIMADEPTGNLDPYYAYEVIELLEKMNRAGKTVLLATHDQAIVNKLHKRVITIADGRVIRDEAKGRFII